jgi:hypothetical protein
MPNGRIIILNCTKTGIHSEWKLDSNLAKAAGILIEQFAVRNNAVLFERASFFTLIKRIATTVIFDGIDLITSPQSLIYHSCGNFHQYLRRSLLA